MKPWDLLLLIFENLGRRKTRVALTAVGVVIGTAAVVVLVSLAIGLQKNATERLVGIAELTQIQVMPNFGEGGGGGGMVMMGQAQGGSAKPTHQKLITNQTLEELAALPGVSSVIPRDFLQMGGTIQLGKLEGGTQVLGVGTDDLTNLGYEARKGELKLERGSAIVGAMVANNFYDPKARPGQPTPTPPELMDGDLRLKVTKYSQDGTQQQKTIPIKVSGVLAQTRGEADYSIFLTMDDVTAMNEWAMGRRTNRQRDGYNTAIVKVKDVDKVTGLTEQITDMGYQTYSPQSFVQGINGFYVILQVIFGGVGAIALLVAAIGIANTMAMAILERTREIGLMKAVGATNRDVLSVFLGEAAGIGFIGGIGGVLVGWSAGQAMNVLALAYLAGQTAKTGGPPTTVAVYTPYWLPFFTLVFATFIGLLSGLYPALRAANMVPVTALKYE
jgi:putative ABC transport system permease protein